jgi:hypothetical protein
MAENKAKNLSVRVEIKLCEKYMEFCKKHRYIFSKRMRVLMEKDLKGEIK